MHAVLFKIGPLTVYTYGFCVFLGALSAYFIGRTQVRKLGVDDNLYSDIFFLGAVMGFISARLLYLIVDWRFFIADPWLALSSRAGFVFYGGAIGCIVTVYFMARRHHIDFMQLADAIILGIPFGHALGRIGCFFYGCCYGRPDEHWGILFPSDSPAGSVGVKVLPTQLIEAGTLFGIFLILLFVNRSRRFPGQLLSVYLIIYGIARFFLEYLRYDMRGVVFFLSTSQLIAIIMIILGILFFVIGTKYSQKNNRG